MIDMIAKTIGTIIIVLLAILMVPVGIGIIGGLFGIVVGIILAIVGSIAGLLGGIFRAIFDVLGWMFHGLFDWDWPFGFFSSNIFTLAAIVLVIALIARPKANGN